MCITSWMSVLRNNEGGGDRQHNLQNFQMAQSCTAVYVPNLPYESFQSSSCLFYSSGGLEHNTVYTQNRKEICTKKYTDIRYFPMGVDGR